MKRIITISFLIAVFLNLSLSAEVIILKTGREIKGKIVERNDEIIKLEVKGIKITYYLEEIKSIDGKKLALPKKDPGKKKKTDNQEEISPELKQAFAEKSTLAVEKGKKLFNQLKYLEAAEEFKAAIELDPERAAAYVGLATTYAFLAKFEEARKAFKQARNLYQKEGEREKVKEINAALINIPHKTE